MINRKYSTDERLIERQQEELPFNKRKSQSIYQKINNKDKFVQDQFIGKVNKQKEQANQIEKNDE